VGIDTYGFTMGKYRVEWGSRIEYFNSYQDITDWFKVVSGSKDASFTVNGRPFMYYRTDE